MITLLEYDGIVTSRQGIVWLCLAVLCLALLTPAAAQFLWAAVLPVCFVFSLAVMIAGVVISEQKPLLADFPLLLPARAPPTLS